MRLLVLDLETTGLDVTTARIIELGYALYEIKDGDSMGAPLAMHSDMVLQEEPLEPIIEQITGITSNNLAEFGQPLHMVLCKLIDFIHTHKIQMFAGHNAIPYDKPLLECELARHNLKLPQLPWLDTRIDLPLEYIPKSTALKYMAADHGFLNPFSHRALFDVLTCGALISQYDFDLLLAAIDTPVIEVRAVVSFQDKDKARKAGFFWDGERKFWIKMIREGNLHKEQNADFQVVKVS